MGLGFLSKWRERRAARARARRAADRARLGAGAGDAASRQFRWAEAEAAYRAYLTARPGDAGVIVRLARTLAASGRKAEAVAELETARMRLRHSPALARALAETAAAPPSPPGWMEVRARPLPEAPASDRDEGGRLWLAAGATARSRALDWLAHALATTGAEVAYADHEIRPSRPGGDWTPVLQPAPHPLELATTPHPPAIALFRAGSAPAAAADLRAFLVEAAARGQAAHVPLVLAEADPPPLAPAAHVAPGMAEAPHILAVVPTRDRGDVLRAMVDSLTGLAARPDRLSILVVDNGSRDRDTLALLSRWSGSGRAEILRIDEPFNWSDLNNRAAAGRDADILLFVNNDMVMRTPGWDTRLALHLARPGVGAVGARLVYPAGNLQHAGMALGARASPQASPGPLHEGLGAAGDDPGPLDRWARARPAAAATGAFLAVPKPVFDQAGGFDARTFPVGGNDVDFCLRVRSLGRAVLYAGDIELSHEESLSRGHDDEAAGRARAEAEREALVRLWGDDALFDPSRSPAWVADGVRLFAGHRTPDAGTVEAWIRRSRDAWRTRRAGAPAD